MRKNHIRQYVQLLLLTVTNEFIGPSLAQYLQEIGTREMKAIQSLKPPQQIALFCGPKLYQPHAKKKLIALASYQTIVNALTQMHTLIANPRIWHNDLHDDNIFVEPHDPERITGIIDWQCCYISPLFNHNPAPAFLDWDGFEPATLNLAPRHVLIRRGALLIASSLFEGHVGRHSWRN